LIALALAAGVSGIAYGVTRAELVDERRDRATTQAYLNARLVRSGLRAAQPDVGAILSSLEGNAGSSGLARVEGEWFASSVGVGPDLIPPALSDAVEGGDAGRAVASVDGVPHVVVGVPIAESSARYFELLSLEDVDATLGSLARNLAIGAAMATAAAALVGWYASGRVLRPLRRMATAASGVAEGDLGTRLDAFGDPDLEPLQASFNRMADAVEERIAREHRFTSDVSHELRSPVAAMLSIISIARREQDDPGALRAALLHLEERTQAFNQLVSDLLEISGVDAGVAELQLEPLDPEAIVRAAVDMTGSEGVEIHIASDVPDTVVADKRRLGRGLMSLLENAQKYAGGATLIDVRKANGYVRFAVEDRGPGIPAHERRHVFGRFARGQQARDDGPGGTGLGLALVEEDARLHGGRVHVADADAGGARFMIDIPIRQAAP
jgi:signal transduction histidine kinase